MLLWRSESNEPEDIMHRTFFIGSGYAYELYAYKKVFPRWTWTVQYLPEARTIIEEIILAVHFS